jgi:hypothetical protein
MEQLKLTLVHDTHWLSLLHTGTKRYTFSLGQLRTGPTVDINLYGIRLCFPFPFQTCVMLTA